MYILEDKQKFCQIFIFILSDISINISICPPKGTKIRVLYPTNNTAIHGTNRSVLYPTNNTAIDETKRAIPYHSKVLIARPFTRKNAPAPLNDRYYRWNGPIDEGLRCAFPDRPGDRSFRTIRWYQSIGDLGRIISMCGNPGDRVAIQGHRTGGSYPIERD
jgi:hypothetical protein